MKAAGDSRDWFRYGHRLQAGEMAWAEFIDARRRRDFRAGFDWNQILILGDFGSGKTSLGIHLARHWFGLGHAVFSNASCLFGWHLEHEEMYTAMGFMPKNSILLIDESSAHLASRVGHGVAISSFSEMNLNTRKQNTVVVYMSAKDWEIAPSIRRSCKEVWMPVPKEDLHVDGEEVIVQGGHGKTVGQAGWPRPTTLTTSGWPGTSGTTTPTPSGTSSRGRTTTQESAPPPHLHDVRRGRERPPRPAA